jgi:hypothetical protein
MPFTTEELSNINNSALETYLDKGKVFKQNVANKPMLKAFDELAGKFVGGNEYVSFAVKAGQSPNTTGLTGYTHDDQVGYYNPTGTKRARFAWKEHHIGITLTHTELKRDGIEIDDSDKTSEMSGREAQALANIYDEKLDSLGEDYAYSLDLLLHGDGTSDTKALAGIGSLILPVPAAGSTGSISRVANTWWANRARTAANSNAVTGGTSDGGLLLAELEKEYRAMDKYATGAIKRRIFAGSDWIDQYLKEIRANGNYSMTGFRTEGVVDGSMAAPAFKGIPIVYDPTLDALSTPKRSYHLDMGARGVRLLYMDGQRMKKHNPSRPYDRYVMYSGITTTAVLVAKQLNTSAVIDIA